jgi:hypothetical protein
MIRTRTVLIAMLALLAACASNPWTVDIFKSPEVDVAGKRSFFYRPGEVAAPLVRQPKIVADTEARMRAAITGELLSKGYVEATAPAGADLVVSYQASGTSKFVESDQQRIGAPSPNAVLTPGNVRPPAASEVPPERSVLIIAVIVFAEDPASGRLAWRGLANLETRTSSTEALVRNVVDMARHVTQQFPARVTQ